MAIMTEQRIRHLPVLVDGKLTDIISIGDLVKQISTQPGGQDRVLEGYISDPYPGPGTH